MVAQNVPFAIIMKQYNTFSLTVTFAISVWQIINIALQIKIPNSIGHIMQQWQSDKGANTKRKSLVGVAAMFWSIWLCRNDINFNKKPITSFMQSIFRGTYWFRFWKLLQKEVERDKRVSNFSLDYVNDISYHII